MAALQVLRFDFSAMVQIQRQILHEKAERARQMNCQEVDLAGNSPKAKLHPFLLELERSGSHQTLMSKKVVRCL